MENLKTEYRSGTITRNAQGGFSTIQQWLDTVSTTDYEVALANARRGVEIQGYQETCVIAVVATVRLKRECEIQESKLS